MWQIIDSFVTRDTLADKHKWYSRAETIKEIGYYILHTYLKDTIVNLQYLIFFKLGIMHMSNASQENKKCIIRAIKLQLKIVLGN